MIKSYRDLIVWQKAIDLTVALYQLCQRFPASERFGLIAQLQRAGVAIPANLAEGHERGSRGDFRRFVLMARGSLAEVETHLEVSNRLGYVSRPALGPIYELTAHIGRMLTVLVRRLRV